MCYWHSNDFSWLYRRTIDMGMKHSDTSPAPFFSNITNWTNIRSAHILCTLTSPRIPSHCVTEHTHLDHFHSMNSIHICRMTLQNAGSIFLDFPKASDNAVAKNSWRWRSPSAQIHALHFHFPRKSKQNTMNNKCGYASRLLCRHQL